MISLTNSAAQTLAAGASMTFDTVNFQTGCGECYRKGTGQVKLRANGIYEITFNANISVATAGATGQLVLQLGGVTLPESLMQSVSAAAGDVHNVACNIAVRNCCGDYDRITITNNGTEAVTLAAYPDLFIKRVC